MAVTSKHPVVQLAKIAVFVALTLSCEKLEKYQFSSTAQSGGFAGMTSFEPSTDGHAVTWEAPEGADPNSTVSLHLLDVSDIANNLVAIKLSGTVVKQTPNLAVYLAEQTPDILVYMEKAATITAGIKDGKYLLPLTTFKVGHSYLLAARWNAPKKDPIWGSHFQFIEMLSEPEVAATPVGNDEFKYGGCDKAQAQSDRRIQIDFQFPEAAKRIMIFRDDRLIHVETNKANTIFVDDQDLVARQWYQYQCVAEHEDGRFAKDSPKVPVQTEDPLASVRNSWNGCSNIRALGASAIEVVTQLPAGVSAIQVLRDGGQVRTIEADDPATFTDEGLQEAREYAYRCDAVSGETVQKGPVQKVSTLVANAPTFNGIKAVTALTPSSVRVEWYSATGTPTRKYLVYAALNNSTNLFSTTPVAVTRPADGLSTVLENLGDEFLYRFAVRACSDEAASICDTNTSTLTRTMADGGAPATLGATEIALVDGELILTIPWQPFHGLVAKRHLYMRTVNDGSANIANYTKVKTIVVADTTAPATTISVNNLAENTSYFFIARDEDGFGNYSQNTAVQSFATGDLTRPIFGSIESLATGDAGQEETVLKVNFTATTSQPADPNGATSYVVYKLVGTGDSCVNGVEHATLPAVNYTSGNAISYPMTGLTPRTMYSVCVKSRDAAGNFSATTAYLSKSTLDTHAPSFDGLQQITYSAAEQKLQLEFNVSSSTDILKYRMRMWRNTATPANIDISNYECLAAGDATCVNTDGTITFKSDKDQFTFVDGETVYAIVEACDSAGNIVGGSENCTVTANSLAKTITVPDATPPQGFTGIKAGGFISSPSQNELAVPWNMPNSLADYFGFRVYFVNETTKAITFAKSCACTTAGSVCPSSCTIGNLDPFRRYCFHVRAYDAANNETAYLDVEDSYSCRTTTDTTPPDFGSQMTVNYSTGLSSISWREADDLQYSGTAGAIITYKVYRKLGSTFTNTTNPAADLSAQLIATTTTRTYDDSALTAGSTHYYIVCAVDGSNNMKCDDSAIRNVRVPDLTPPVFTAGLSSNHTSDARRWTLKFRFNDADPSTVTATLFRTATDSASTPTTSSTVKAGYEAIDPSTIYNSSTNYYEITDSGQINANKYINYLLELTDSDGNKSTSSLSVYAQFEVKINEIRRNSGRKDQSRILVIEGQGFQPGVTVMIGTDACTNVTLQVQGYRRLHHNATTAMGSLLTCNTPITTQEGPVNVVVSNTDGSYVTSVAGYTLCDPTQNLSSATDYCSHACDTFGAGSYAGGSGTSGSPYLICNATHLQNAISAGSGSAYFFKQMDNINLSGVTLTNNANAWPHGYDGNELVIANYTANSNGISNFGLFGQPTGTAKSISNLMLLGVQFTHSHSATPNTKVGILAGYVPYTATLSISDIFIKGTTTIENTSTSSQYIGGIVGQYAGGTISRIYADLTFVTGTVTGMPVNVGGIVGYLSSGADLNDVYMNGTVRGGQSTGGVVGSVSTTSGSVISDIHSTANVFGTLWSGGLLGTSSTGGVTISNSDSTGDVTGTSTNIGGVVGYCSGAVTLSNLTLTGVDVSGSTHVGGLIGYVVGAATINSIVGSNLTVDMDGGGTGYGASLGIATSQGDITATDVTLSGTLASGTGGGLLGNNSGGFLGYHVSVSKSVSLTNVNVNGSIATSYNGGGLVGTFGNTGSTLNISKSSFVGSISGSNIYMGGLIGAINSGGVYVISRSYALPTITNSSKGAGGLIGGAAGAAAGSSIVDSYSRGTVTSSTADANGTSAGGIYGSIDATSATNTSIARVYTAVTVNAAVNNSVQRGGLVIPRDGGCPSIPASVIYASDMNSTSDNGCLGSASARTSAQMKTQNDSVWSGFDFDNVWQWTAGSGVFPSLRP